MPKVTQLVIHTAELGFKPRLTDWWGFPGGSDSKESTCNAGDPGSIPGLGRSLPWRREWPPTPVFLPGEFHGQRSLEGYSPWSHRVGHDWVTNTFTLLFHYWLILRSLSTCCGLSLAETILTHIYRTSSMGQVSSCGARAVVTQTAVPALMQLILCWGNSFPYFTWNFISQSPKDQVFPGCSEVTSWLVAPTKSTQHTEPRRTRSYPSLPQSFPKVAHHSENQISSSSVSIVTLPPNTVRTRVSLSHSSCPSSWWPHDLQVLATCCFVCSSPELTAHPVLDQDMKPRAKERENLVVGHGMGYFLGWEIPEFRGFQKSNQDTTGNRYVTKWAELVLLLRKIPEISHLTCLRTSKHVTSNETS